MKFFFSLKIHCLQVFQLFQSKDGPFFFIVTLVYTCRAFFAVSSENICPIYCFGHSSSQSVSQWNSFSPLKYIVYKCFSCFRPRMGQNFSSLHLSTLVALFFALSSENIYPMYCFGHNSSQSVSQWNSFSPLKYIVYKCFSCFRPVMGHFFHLHTCLHLSCFFCSIIRKYLSHILFWSQLLSVCFTMKLFFSFKIHCLQMFQLFQTRDGPFFFVVTLVYTCHTFFALSSENICPIYIWLHYQDFLKRKYLYITYCIYLYNILCWRYQSWRRYLLQLSRRYSATRRAPSEIRSLFVQYMYKSIRDQIWPCHKIGQGQLSIIIWANLVVHKHMMMHTKF